MLCIYSHMFLLSLKLQRVNAEDIDKLFPRQICKKVVGILYKRKLDPLVAK